MRWSFYLRLVLLWLSKRIAVSTWIFSRKIAASWTRILWSSMLILGFKIVRWHKRISVLWELTLTFLVRSSRNFLLDSLINIIFDYITTWVKYLFIWLANTLFYLKRIVILLRKIINLKIWLEHRVRRLKLILKDERLLLINLWCVSMR